MEDPVTRLTENVVGAVGEVQAARDQLLSHLTDAGAHGDLAALVNAAKSDLRSVTGRVAASESEIASLNTASATHTSQITTLQTGLGTAQTSITTLQNNLGTAQTSITSLQNSLGTAQTSITTLQTQSSGSESAITDLQTSVSTLNTNISKLVPKAGDRGSLAGYSTVSSLSGSQTITKASPDYIYLAANGAVTLTFTQASATECATKIIALKAQGPSTLAVSGASWAFGFGQPGFGNVNDLLVLVAHFMAGVVLLSVFHNSRGIG